jgi:cytochrome c peroxidase
VANHLPRGRADVALVAATISIIDLEAAEVVKELQLPNGSGSLNDLRISPDGKYAAVAHTISRFHRPASSVRRGWMNINALSIIDINTMALYNTVILDDLDSGAANPCGVAWTPDGATVLVTHSGTHEVSFIDFHMVLDQLPNLAATPPSKDLAPYETYLQKAEAAESIPFLMASHPRIKLPATDLGPRAVIVAGHSAYVANYFSETLTAIDLASPDHKVESILLTSQPEIGLKRKPRNREDVLAQMRPERRGEFYFHDASICDQGWQSCSSCHPDGRADGLNWDLLNDGFDNPKNTKSLLLAHRTPPCMWLGVRETAESAVRSGIRNILFTKQPEHVAADIDAYLKSLKPIPSPYLVYPHTNDSVRIEASLSLLTDPAGVSADKKKQLTTERPPSKSGLSVPAKRGAIAFTRAGCAGCHPPPLFTNRRQYDVGTRGPFDKPVDKFDTPTLIELWRTAPYLHDGSAITVREIMTTRNPHDAHGTTSILTSEEIDDLCAYVLSL